MNYKTEVVDGKNVIYSSDWIKGLESEIHFTWYYYQALLVYNNCVRDQSIIEIGIGTALLSDLLKRRGWNIKTLDIDPEKGPDFCCNALDFEYKSLSCDVILAFEIFEHIPFETFKKLVRKFSCQGVNNIYFSVPWNERIVFSLKLKLPKIPLLRIDLRIPRKRIESPAHFWELNLYDGFLDSNKQFISIKQLRKVFLENNYSLKKINKVFSIQYFSAIKLNNA